MLKLVLLIALTSLPLALCDPIVILDDASAFCVTCYGRRIHKPMFADPTDCHKYYNCFFYNETFAAGIKQSCPVGTFFNDDIQTCVPEGAVQCTDRCRDDDVGTVGCYAVDNSCNAFFYCSRGISYPFCCPAGTRFNSSNCNCDYDETCLDSCKLPSPAPTTVQPPVSLDTGRCVDSFNVVLGVHYDSNGNVVADQFNQYESNDTAANYFVRSCAYGTVFSLDACSCNETVDVENDGSYRQCLLYLPFNENVADYSVHKLETNSENVEIDHTDAARGNGSALIGQDGLVRIWGSPGIDYGNSLSICLFYQSGGASLNKTGGLFANSKEAGSSEYSFALVAQPDNTVVASFSFVNPVNTQSVTINVANQTDFNQVCVVVANSTITTYVNGVQQSQVPVSGRFNIGHCAAYVGRDFAEGSTFQDGHIDEVLVCRQGLNSDEVQAHYSGQAALQSAGLVPS